MCSPPQLNYSQNSHEYWFSEKTRRFIGMHKEFFSPFPIVDQPEADNNRLKSSLLALICILAANYANEGIETFNFAETSPVSQKQNILTAVDNSISNGNYFY